MSRVVASEQEPADAAAEIAHERASETICSWLFCSAAGARRSDRLADAADCASRAILANDRRRSRAAAISIEDSLRLCRRPDRPHGVRSAAKTLLDSGARQQQRRRRRPQRKKTIHTIVGLAEPQGVGYAPTTDTVYVANARDGSVRLFHGGNYAPAGAIELGKDADNIRFDAAANRLLIGYGDGALAAVDAAQSRKVADFPLPGHPESFQISRDRSRIFVNVPGAHAIVVLDAADGKEKSKWPLHESGNFPMAIDQSNGRVLAVSRNPPKLKVYAEEDGAVVASVDTCGDSDDLFVDPRRPRVYVSCGAGFIDVFEVHGATYDRVGHIKTVTGARTSLLVSELDVFLLAVRATITEAAAVWVYKPQP